jgi:hypothetical protein
MLLVGLVVIATWLAFHTHRHYRRSFTIATMTLGGTTVKWPFLFLVVIAAISAIAGLMMHHLSSVGVFFPVVAGLVTITGFLFTLNKLDDIFSRILSYDILVDRCAEMIDKEIRSTADGDRAGRILIIANAVTFGNISAYENHEGLLKKLYNAFNNQHISVRIICCDWDWLIPEGMSDEEKKIPIKPANGELQESSLDDVKQTSLGKLYWQWSKCGHWDDETLRRPYYQAVGLMNVLRGARASSEYPIRKEAYAFPDRFAPLHMVVTSTRALLFHVVDFPIEGKISKERVHVIGSETSDSAIIQRLMEAFEYHADQCHKKIG